MKTNDARRAHKILDDLFKGRLVMDEEREFLRSALPELPKQKTLEEIIAHVYDAWKESSGHEWGGNSDDTNIPIEDWLGELRAQLIGLKDAPVSGPALPAGMRIADHEKYGRCVASPRPNGRGEWEIMFAADIATTGAGLDYVRSDTLTFIDAEPAESAEPAHPVFLETREDYRNAPMGTVVAQDDMVTAWVKTVEGWSSTDGDMSKICPSTSYTRRVLRWGRGNE